MADRFQEASWLEQRRCPHCGTRVAQQAKTCFMCGREVRIRLPRRRFVQRISPIWMIVTVLLGLLVWQIVGRDGPSPGESAPEVVVLPPTLPPPTHTPEPTRTPTPRPPTPTPWVPTPVVHTVESGEVLQYIATLYEITVDELMVANEMTSTIIHSGDQLVIPGQFENPPTPTPESGTPRTGYFTYKVQPGDSVISIAYRFGASPEEIFDANSLTSSSLLYKDDVLQVPVPLFSDDVEASSDLAPRVTNAIYAAPKLLHPGNAALVARQDPVNFRWLPVDILAPNEWYVLRIWTNQGDDPPTIWTKATSHWMETDMAPVEGGSREYFWHVTVVRVVAPTIPGAPRELESASLTSEERRFTWQ